METSKKSTAAAINLSEISHHDLAWVEGSFSAETKFVNNEISVALDAIAANPDVAWSHELAIFIREFLKAHPERREELAQRLKEGRFEIGAGYSSPYTSAVPGEILVRQFICGKKWVDDAFPGYRANVFYNTDIPGMTAQFPQILAKSGVEYLYASRSWNFPGFDHTELKKWKALDGTQIKTLFLNHYGNAWGRCGGDINSDDYLIREVRNFEKHQARQKLGDKMPLIYSSDSIVSIDFSQRLESWNRLAAEKGLPPMTYSTVQKALDQVFAGEGDFSRDTLEGDWPNTWFYESNPADYEAYKQHKIAERLLRAAETLSVIRAILTDSFDEYPAETISQAWLALEMVCHGFAPRGAIDDFEASYEKGFALARELYEQQLTWLVSQVSAQGGGIPVVVWNNLSQARSEVVTMDCPESQTAFQVTTAQGHTIPCQIGRDGKLVFVAENVPSMGYAVYYLIACPKSSAEAVGAPWTEAFENDFYRVTPAADGTLASVTDLQTGKELFDCSKFSIGQILNFQYDGMGAGEHLNIWQPHDPKAAQLKSGWRCVENGPVRTVFEAAVSQEAGTALLCVSLYSTMKKLDFDVTLEGFGETPKNQVRMMFPIAMDSPFGENGCADGKNTKITYEVPFGAVTLGQEVLPRFSRFNDNSTDPNDVGGDSANLLDYEKISGVRPRNVQNWIRAENKDFFVSFSSFNLGWDYQDATAEPVRTPVLQPVLLSVSKSCHGGFGHWVQPGVHSYHFSMTSGVPAQTGLGESLAVSANNPLDARIQNEKGNAAKLPESWSAFGVNSDHIAITAVKQAEDFPGKVVIRWYETQGKPAENTRIRLPDCASVKAVQEVSLIEAPAEGCCMARTASIQTDTDPWSIRTVMVDLG